MLHNAWAAGGETDLADPRPTNECPLQELTGKLPRAFPLETGEKPPPVQRRAGLTPSARAEVSGRGGCTSGQDKHCGLADGPALGLLPPAG